MLCVYYIVAVIFRLVTTFVSDSSIGFHDNCDGDCGIECGVGIAVNFLCCAHVGVDVHDVFFVCRNRFERLWKSCLSYSELS